MEEVWKEIKLATLCDYSKNNVSPTTTNHSSTFRSLFRDDFLIGPCNTESSKSPLESTTLMASLEQPHPTPTFTSPADWNKRTLQPFLSSPNPSLDALDSSKLCHWNTNKNADEEISNPDDRRHKRKIKNRESAARSRARKQAYTNELELELARLREENARLRRQQDKLCFAYPARHNKKRTLYRTLTAPY
ncbi:hypothetical protein L6164_024889 [Bauhinia variegata]|uniref:Uncharacterized protein n=1 Tax=Bauhinia variegata TaxID=167791 RepID=A0ACB9M0J8_BAUVA|nr:hypothetical protein L6164_024889 [Bauhinia variegata]